MNEERTQMILQYIKKEYLDDDSSQTIDMNTKLISSGIVDSFSMVSLKTFIEKKFQIRIPDHKATSEAFDTVGSIMKLIDESKNT